MPRPEDRAASEVIGAVIVFGFLVVAFSIYQGVIIPQQNKAIEFDHNEDAQDAIQDLRNAIRQTATTAAEESVSIQLGASYPQRVLGVNPGASAGTIQTESLPAISIRNVSANDPETADYFGSVTTTLGSFESKAIIYRPIYFQYQNAPDTLYENTLAFNQFPGGTNLTITNQAVIDDRKITLIALAGNVSQARQGTVSIDTNALSTATNTVAVTNESGPVNITIGTRLTVEDWNDTLEGELVANGGHVTAIKQTGSNQVSIILEEGITYDLRLAKVGVGDDTTNEGGKYIVNVEGDDTSLVENGTRKLVVEVRDRFNNPVSNVSVSASIVQAANASGSSETVTPSSATTDSDGRASFTYTAPEQVNGAQEADINMTFSGDGTVRNETVTFDVRVLDADGSGSGVGGGGGGGGGANNGSTSDEINPSSDTESLVWVNATAPDSGQGGYKQNGDPVTVFFNNTDGSNTATITDIRYQFYSLEGQGAGSDLPKSLTFDDASNTVNLVGDFTQLSASPTFSPGETASVTVQFFEEEDGNGDELDSQPGDFFIISIKYTLNGENRQGTYFIGVSTE